MTILSSIGSFILDILETVVVSLLIFVVVYVFIAQPFQVKGLSMMPNFHDGDYMLTSKITYRFREPERGDVIVFKYPNAPQYDYIKRIIGLPGDSVKLTNGKIYLNGNLLEEQYLPDNTLTYGKGFLKDGVSYNVPVNNYFVMGDNREHSSDSRQWGPLPKENLIGNSWIRYWPPQALAVIQTPEY